MEIPINYLAVVVAAVANIALGFLWFGPLFGRKWLEVSGRTAEAMEAAGRKSMTKTYALQALGAFVMSYTLAHAIIFGSAYTNTFGIAAGLMASFWYWLGFVAPVTMGSVLWENRPWVYWFITAGYYLVALLVMGSILAVWQ